MCGEKTVPVLSALYSSSLNLLLRLVKLDFGLWSCGGQKWDATFPHKLEEYFSSQAALDFLGSEPTLPA